MKTIGMLGGMSWESTVEYYRLANETVRRRMGGYHSAPILMDSVDFADIETLQRTGDWDTAGELLAAHARRLEAAGADMLLLCTNTMHKVIDQIEDALDIPVLHIADAAASAVIAAGIDRVLLLGTAFTMQEAFYRSRIEAHGISVSVPTPEDQRLVHAIIYDELVHGIVDDFSREALHAIIGQHAEAGAQGVILGCTELELLIEQHDTTVHVFPTAALHVEAAVDAALGAA